VSRELRRVAVADLPGVETPRPMGDSVLRKCCVCIGSGFRYFRDEQGTGYCECQNCKGTGEEPEEEKEEVA
jgi:hypothetical protein